MVPSSDDWCVWVALLSGFGKNQKLQISMDIPLSTLICVAYDFQEFLNQITMKDFV